MSMFTKAEVERVARIAHVLINAALANRDIQAHLADPKPPRLWTIERIRRNPTCRVEWEHAAIIGGVGESLAAARHKNWGQFIGVLPLDPDDPVHWCRLLYIYKASSPYNRRVEQRHALKRILGRKYRSLVTLASRSTKKDFLARLSEFGGYQINRRLRLDPARFWRVAKGKEFIVLPKAAIQLSLFPEQDDALNEASDVVPLSLVEDHCGQQGCSTCRCR